MVILSERLGQPGEEESRLEAAGVRVESTALYTHGQIVAGAAFADMIILGAVEPFDAKTLSALPQLRAVVRRGVGFDNVDVQVATDLGIVVANVPDASIEEVSDHALALLLTLERNILQLDRFVRDGTWRSNPASVQRERVRGRRLTDLTLGVIGFGRIGRALVRKARSIYADILVVDPFISEADVTAAGARLMSLSELLKRADHVSLHVPMEASNQHMIGEPELSTMREGAILVNTARGGLIDEIAVANALRSGHLGGVGLDVTAEEPVSERADVLTLEGRLLLTGHSAAWSETAARNLAVSSVDAALALVAGQRPRSLVNPEVLTSPLLRIPKLATVSL